MHHIALSLIIIPSSLLKEEHMLAIALEWCKWIVVLSRIALKGTACKCNNNVFFIGCIDNFSSLKHMLVTALEWCRWTYD
jgi:hypothetical protein